MTKRSSPSARIEVRKMGHMFFFSIFFCGGGGVLLGKGHTCADFQKDGIYPSQRDEL